MPNLAVQPRPQSDLLRTPTPKCPTSRGISSSHGRYSTHHADAKSRRIVLPMAMACRLGQPAFSRAMEERRHYTRYRVSGGSRATVGYLTSQGQPSTIVREQPAANLPHSARRCRTVSGSPAACPFPARKGRLVYDRGATSLLIRETQQSNFGTYWPKFHDRERPLLIDKIHVNPLLLG